VHAFVREIAPTLTDDRPPAPDIERIAATVVDGSFERACGVDVK
jgi:histidine ammonia-lyase